MINVGCSSSGCRNSSGQDLIQVSAYLYPQPPASAGCTAAIISSDNGWVTGTTGNYFLDITNANGASRPVYVSFTCTPTPTYTCGGGAPNYSNTTEQCQQQPTVTGCLDGWEKSKTNNTCPPPATCCSPIACTAPTAPAPSLVCSL